MVGTITKKTISSLLNLPLRELVFLADKARGDSLGSKLELCSIINAKSGLCGQDCKFCAQSLRYHTNIARYPLKGKEEIVRAAKAAKKNGAEYFGIVTSGGRLSKKELKEIVFAVAEITKKVDINICASLGALGREELAALKQAGLSRYHHNIETSARFYAEVVSTHKFKERLNTIKAASAAGLEVCSGGIIGMGETWQDRIDMALLLKELGVSSIPINFLVPIKGTPFESLKPLSVNDAIRTIAIFRIILKDKIVKIAAGREAVLGDFQGLGFMAGANGMLIGGYLTIKGRKIQSDHRLIKEIETLWRR
ncbi:MAG: biotin synthase BioB [Candidatus Omnitrophica bacterium]|nr:biotin synthase BioB [Candidatus Omnitrophota bacterium]